MEHFGLFENQTIICCKSTPKPIARNLLSNIYQLRLKNESPKYHPAKKNLIRLNQHAKKRLVKVGIDLQIIHRQIPLQEIGTDHATLFGLIHPSADQLKVTLEKNS